MWHFVIKRGHRLPLQCPSLDVLVCLRLQLHHASGLSAAHRNTVLEAVVASKSINDERWHPLLLQSPTLICHRTAQILPLCHAQVLLSGHRFLRGHHMPSIRDPPMEPPTATILGNLVHTLHGNLHGSRPLLPDSSAPMAKCKPADGWRRAHFLQARACGRPCKSTARGTWRRPCKSCKGTRPRPCKSCKGGLQGMSPAQELQGMQPAFFLPLASGPSPF